MFTDDVIEPLLPFDGWYPFNKVNWYYIALIWESFMTSIVVCIYGFVSMTNSSFTLSLCMELKVLGYSIESIISENNRKNIVKGINKIETNNGIKNNLKNIIKRHQLLAQMASEFNDVTGDPMFLNYVFGSVFITLTIFTATVVDNLYNSLRYFFMFCSLLLEIFFQCLNGQLLSDHSETLTGSIYKADWTYADNDTKIILLILMSRTQKPFQYTANGFLVMNLESFSSVCSMSYQFFNLLYTMYYN
uniref:Odorant receptor n=1 Tax=Leucinodes orbonalis TaxID=711050 RepID=A0AAU0QMM9_9NEOP|nr:odorant receptor [Leucinodes orbonalis]